jgi:uroporphyrinogen-III synthase
VDDFRAAGLVAAALPLIVIEPAADAEPLRAAWRRLSDYAALMFVSAAAVEHFFFHAEKNAVAARPRFWATGPGTARALRRAGVPDEAIDAPPPDAASFDSEALWERVKEQVSAGVRVLIVPPSLGDEERALALDGAEGRAVWLFSSSEAISNLRLAMPTTGWQAASAVATHARIGEAARAAGFGAVRVCSPQREALIASIESFS